MMRSHLVTPLGTLKQISEDEFAVFRDVGWCVGVCDTAHLLSLGMPIVTQWISEAPRDTD